MSLVFNLGAFLCETVFLTRFCFPFVAYPPPWWIVHKENVFGESRVDFPSLAGAREEVDRACARSFRQKTKQDKTRQTKTEQNNQKHLG